MIAKSTGLGKSKIIADITDLKPEGDILVLHLMTSEPEGWHLRSALQFQDIKPLILGFMKPGIILFMIRSIFSPKKNPKEPEDF